MTPNLEIVAAQIERYIQDYLFDPDGLMYSYIDVRTGKPFEREPLEHLRRPFRGQDDPVTYWSYEDSIITGGLYMEALVLKHEVTGDAAALEQAFRIWETYKLVYYASQVFGIGSFLRPYGGFADGFEVMSRWAEPLGTDQASPLLSAQYAMWRHAADRDRKEIADIAVNTLSWYEEQDFRYLWYKALIHSWQSGPHAGSYYLPGIAFAAKVTGEAKWRRLLEEKLRLFEDPRYNVCEAFIWGGDLIMLADLLGPGFGKAFPAALFDRGYQKWQEQRATYSMPGMVRYACHQNPEVFQPDFKPFKIPIGRPNLDAYYIHQGRERPGAGAGSHFLCALAALNYPGALEEALEVAGVFTRAPEDFTVFLAEDHDRLPEEGFTRLQSRCVGTGMVGWYRNYWRLRKALQGSSATPARGSE